MKLFTAISAGAFALLSAFIIKRENTIQATPLYETKWSLKKIYSSAGEQEVNTNAFIKFNQERKSAGGNGSCNSYGSNFTLTKNHISFTNIFSTKMYCDGVQNIEDAFFKQLGRTNQFEIKEKTLLLYHDQELLLEFASE